MAVATQTSPSMQAAIVRWLHGFLVPQSVEALMPEVPGCERLLRSHGVDVFKEHRPKELRRQDAESEHAIRDLTRIRPPKGTRPKTRR